MRIRRTPALVTGLVAASLALAACSNGGSTTDPSSPAGGDAAEQTEVEVFTWWASGSEKLGLDALVSVFDTQHPNVEFINGAVAGGAGSAAKDLLQSRLQANDPPDTFQAHAGAELTDYINAGQIEDIANLFDEFGLRNAFPADLVDRLTVDGKIYSVPSNIHRANVVWANPTVITEAGLDPEATYASLDEWFTAFDTIQAAGFTPLSVATTWTQVHLLETVLLAELGVSTYNGLWDGTTDWAGAEVTGALEAFEKAMSYTNTDRDGLDWPDATQQVMDGQAAFNVMGDWAVAAFEEAGKAAGTDFTYFPVPGTDGVFDFLADSFTLPVGAPHPDGAKAWLETVGSLEGQVAFNKAKGSIPARTDADPAEFSEYQQTAIESFGSDQIVSSLAHGAATPIAALNAISDATSKFTTGGSDLATFQSELAAAMG
ncbi:MAG: carbohydrate ABC transporter substrate-binding protein [Actinomycetales bacterium]|nr:carbohydrate ABC transporter substrate-binding protein [Actinomycetales bacterium]